MKILFGIPDKTHRELANLEIKGIKALNPDCSTIHYGPVRSKSGLVNKILNTIRNAFIIKEVLKKNRFDLLFLNSTFDFNGVVRDSITYWILKPTRTKVFLKFHGSDPDLLFTNRWYKKKLSEKLLSSVDGIGVLSADEKDTYTRNGFPAEKIFIIKNPVNPELYEKDTNFKSKLGLDSRTFVFIFVARFLPFKGLMDVLEAMKIVKSKFQDIHLFCIGDGPDMIKAQQFVLNSNIESFVTFTGFISETDVSYFYSNTDALIFPSSHEGFPMAVFQSLAAGIPIITTRIAASADYLEEPENVLWVEFHNITQIAECMTRLLSDKDLVIRMKTNNAKKAYQFTTDKNASEYQIIFEKLLKEW